MRTCNPETVREARAEVRRFMRDRGEQLLVIETGPHIRWICVVLRSVFARVALLRCSIMLGLARSRIMPQFVKRWLLRLAGATVGRGVFVGPRVVIDPLFPSLIEIGDDCLLGEGCRVWAHDVTAKSVRIGRVRLGKGSVVGGCAMIHCGVTVGDGATVGACSLVVRNVPDGASVLGVPARRIPTADGLLPDAPGADAAGAGGREDGAKQCSS